MRKTVSFLLGAVVVIGCVAIVYEHLRDMRYRAKIPSYLRLCKEHSAQAPVAASEEGSKEAPVSLAPLGAELVATKLGMTALALEIAMNARDVGSLPKSLDRLNVERKRLFDGWSNRIVYVRDSDRTFILCSPGSNGTFEGELEGGEIGGKWALDLIEKHLRSEGKLKYFGEVR